MIYVTAEVIPASVFVAFYTAELQDRVPLQAQSVIQFWLDRESRYTIETVSAGTGYRDVSCLSSLC